MSEEFFVIRIKNDSPWIISTRAFETQEHRDPEFKTAWTEPLGSIEIDVDDEQAEFWPDLIGCGGKIAGFYVSEYVKGDWDAEYIDYGKAIPATVIKQVPGRLRDKAPPTYFWIKGHLGAEIDYENSGYKIIGRSSTTGKVYTDHRTKPKRIVFAGASWDGSHLFLTGFPPTRFFCTRKIIEIVTRNGRSNFCFVPIEKATDLSHPGVS